MENKKEIGFDITLKNGKNISYHNLPYRLCEIDFLNRPKGVGYKGKFLILPFGIINKSLFYKLCQIPDNPLFVRLYMEYNFLDLVQETELIIMERSSANQTVDENNIALYYLAVAQLQYNLQSVLSSVKGKEFGYSISLPTGSLNFNTDKPGEVVNTKYGKFNSKLISALGYSIREFLYFLAMMSECIKIKVVAEKCTEQMIKENDIIDPLNIGVWNDYSLD